MLPEVRFMSTYRDYLKKLTGDLLIVGIKAPYIPLQGVCSIIDWRLSGFISSLILTHKLGDTSDNPVLIPSNGKLPVQRAALLTYDKDIAYRTSQICKGIKSKNLSIVLPVNEENKEYRIFMDKLKASGMKWAVMRTFLMNKEMVITLSELTYGQ
jgi:hypothetical protein